MKSKIIVCFSTMLLLLGLFNKVSAQHGERDYYTLVKGGKKYLKPVRYITLHRNDKKKTTVEAKSISFFIEGQEFEYLRKRHKNDTIARSIYDDIVLSTVHSLFEDEFNEYQTKLKIEGLSFPPPMSHNYLKVYVLEKISSNCFVRYEVDWVYAMQ